MPLKRSGKTTPSITDEQTEKIRREEEEVAKGEGSIDTYKSSSREKQETQIFCTSRSSRVGQDGASQGTLN